MNEQNKRPPFSKMLSGEEFKAWYWLKAELVEICKRIGLPYSGGKFELRDRIAFALDHPGEQYPISEKKKSNSKFNWAKENLSKETIITDTISFGPNFRNFMKSQIGNRFNCHGDFMEWARANSGKTLGDAVIEWERLEQRKEDPNFKRMIRPHNMFNQYLRDFFEATSGKTLQDAKTCWARKKAQKTAYGVVRFDTRDLGFLE